MRPFRLGGLDFDRLESLISERTKLPVVNFPHNPTGSLPTGEQFEQLIELCRRHGIYLFCDEMYRGLEPDKSLRLPSAVDRYEHAITLSGLSKTYGLPGLRSGWLVVRDQQLREELINWKHIRRLARRLRASLWR